MNILLLFSIGLFFLSGVCSAEEQVLTDRPPVTRINLLTALIPSNKAIAKVEVKEVTIGPGGHAPLHLHPCVVVGVVTEGEITFEIEGQPQKLLNVGDAFYEPENVRVSRFDNDGKTQAKFTAFYLLENGRDELIQVLAR
jgi:quercetin dioxygenase-like cupin family protein